MSPTGEGVHATPDSDAVAGDGVAGPRPPVLGRPSPASTRPAALRVSASAGGAAYRADGGDAPGWALRAASVAGVRHRLAGTGPEDAFAWRVHHPPGHAPLPPAPDEASTDEAGIDSVDDGRPATDRVAAGQGGTGRAGSSGAMDGPPTVVLAVADGVGGVPGSGKAAAAAVDAAADAAAAALERGAAATSDPAGSLWRDAMAAAAGAVRAAGGATTLVLAVVTGAGEVTVARVGDSTALVLHGGAWAEMWPPGPADDSPVSTATAALPGRGGADPVPEVAAAALAPGAALVLVTDGVVNPLRDGPTTVAPALAAALDVPPSPLGLALVTDFSRQGCFDDRTVVGLWRTTAPPAPHGQGVPPATAPSSPVHPDGAGPEEGVPPAAE